MIEVPRFHIGVRVSAILLLAGASLLGGCGAEDAAAPERTPRVADQAAPDAPAAPAVEEIFTDRAVELGVDFTHFNGMWGGFYTAEVTAAGCGMLDYDNDGDLDLYLPQGNVIGSGKSIADAHGAPAAGMLPLVDRLYRNDLEVGADGVPSLRFTDVTEESRIESTGYGMGLAAGDYDNDGDLDLYVANLEKNAFWRNEGDGTFSDVVEPSGTQDKRWSVPTAFVDYDRDGWLDLFVGNYVSFDPDDDKTCFRVTGARDFCGPLAYREAQDSLFHNQGDGRFADVTRAAGINAAYGSALGIAIADVNSDGWLEIYVGNDGRPNQLWINQQDGTFIDEALMRGAAVNAEGFAEASMGVVAGDFDGNGSEDLFMAHLLGETNTIYANDGSGMYDDVSVRSGLGTPSKWATAFGAAALDYDNDGMLDILTANGEVRVIEEQARNDVPFPLRQPNQLFRNLGGGRFAEVTDQAGPAFAEQEVSRGAAVGDVDNDGDHDVLVLNNNGPAQLLINNLGNRNPWLGLRMVGGAVERDMLGTWVGLFRPGRDPMWRRVGTEGSFASVSDPRVLFGLGDEPDVEKVRAHWPSGRVEEWTEVPVGRYTTLREGSGQAVD